MKPRRNARSKKRPDSKTAAKPSIWLATQTKAFAAEREVSEKLDGIVGDEASRAMLHTIAGYVFGLLAPLAEDPKERATVTEVAKLLSIEGAVRMLPQVVDRMAKERHGTKKETKQDDDAEEGTDRSGRGADAG